jgi:hypothetical protein
MRWYLFHTPQGKEALLSERIREELAAGEVSCALEPMPSQGCVLLGVEALTPAMIRAVLSKSLGFLGGNRPVLIPEPDARTLLARHTVSAPHLSSRIEMTALVRSRPPPPQRDDLAADATAVLDAWYRRYRVVRLLSLAVIVLVALSLLLRLIR